MNSEDIYKRLTPKSEEILKTINPRFVELNEVSPNDIVIALAAVDSELMVIIKDLRIPSRAKNIKIQDWLVDAYHEAYISDSEVVDAYHLVFAFLLNINNEEYYKAKKVFPNEYRFAEAAGLKPYYENFSWDENRHANHTLIGREKEITRLMVNLSSQSSKPSLLIGETGSGKTTLLRELAKRIHEGKTPDALKGVQIIRVKFSALLGVIPSDISLPAPMVFSHLLNSIANMHAKPGEKIILFIDDVRFHSSIFIGFELTPDSSRDVLLVGAAEDDVQGKLWDIPIFRMWDVISVGDQTDEEYEQILIQHGETYKELQGINFSDESISKIVETHKDELSLDALPGGAIKTMELLAIYKTHLQDGNGSVVITEGDVQSFFDGDFEKVEKGTDNVYDTKLLDIENELKKTIIGQDEAIEALARALRVSSLKLDALSRPIGSFLFLGPTGVGKTQTAKELAIALFGYRDTNNRHPSNFLRIDMSEYAEKHTVSKLFGAPPGYVGYDDGGAVTDFVSLNPRCVILFDEIDKAHPEVLNALLHIMDEGELRNNSGEMVSFEDVIVVMTSNHGANLISQGLMGYQKGQGAAGEKSHTDIKKELLSHVKKVMKPEFLNRFDDMIVFKQLSDENMLKILDIFIVPITETLEKKGVSLLISKRARTLLVKNGSSKEYGARELRRTLNRELIDPMSKILLENKSTDQIRVSTKCGVIKLTSKAKNHQV